MPRVKRGTNHVKKRRKLLKAVKGYKWGRNNLVRMAKTARTKAGAHAFTDRRKKKRSMRSLWQIKISASAKENGLSYSRLIGNLKKNNIIIDRKVMADLAENNPSVFKEIVNKVK